MASAEVEAAIARGMRAQLAGLEAARARGVARLGWKVGFNDPRVQARLGLDGALVGVLAAERALPSGRDAPRARRRAPSRRGGDRDPPRP